MRQMMAADFLEFIPPSLDYKDWLSVGMALHHAGEPCSKWDEWSSMDHRPGKYHATGSESCQAHWSSFTGATSKPYTIGTLIHLARQHGWVPERSENFESGGGGRAYALDEVIKPSLTIIDQDWLEDTEICEPDDNWHPLEDLKAYLMAVFEPNDYVSYVTETFDSDDRKFLPTRGVYHRTRDEILKSIDEYDGDLNIALSKLNPEAGAWVRFNPMDGVGIKDENVTDFRYALIECDEIPIEKQAAIYAKLELPCVAQVHSGKKSLHAIVKVQAKDKDEYRKRVDYLHEVLQANGIEKKAQANKNPSRLSRLPGVMREGRKQYLVSTHTGKDNWLDWVRFIEESNDNLPDIENLADWFHNPPELSEPLIEGLLRKGHKMLLSGPSKSAKSFALLELCIAVAEAGEWLGWKVSTQGRVLYVNLELDRASCYDRLIKLYKAHGIPPNHIEDIDIWHLRGKAAPLASLAPSLIRRALQKKYSAIIIDPMYKIGAGDENAADQITLLFNQIDKICVTLGTAVIVCHHHSKGAQGQKSAKDRSSGSGVFAREPDAVVDLIELKATPQTRYTIDSRFVKTACVMWLEEMYDDWESAVTPEQLLDGNRLLEAIYASFRPTDKNLTRLNQLVTEARTAASQLSGWRVEGALREFPNFTPRNILFKYPIHVLDKGNLMGTSRAEGEIASGTDSPSRKDVKDVKAERAEVRESRRDKARREKEEAKAALYQARQQEREERAQRLEQMRLDAAAKRAEIQTKKLVALEEAKAQADLARLEKKKELLDRTEEHRLTTRLGKVSDAEFLEAFKVLTEEGEKEIELNTIAEYFNRSESWARGMAKNAEGLEIGWGGKLQVRGSRPCPTIDEAFDQLCKESGCATVSLTKLAVAIDQSEPTTRARISKLEQYTIWNGFVARIPQ